MAIEKEFKFDQKQFDFICQLVLEETGISLNPRKFDMVYSRLTRRLRKLNLATFGDYCDLLKKGDVTEIGHFVNAITTNLTSFFREKHHFEFLHDELLPKLFTSTANHRLRIWSAGCSTGEEPYSIAMVVNEIIPKTQRWDVKILATDLDTNVLAHAKRGIYDATKVTGISDKRLKRNFILNKKTNELQVKPELMELITFKQLNLMNSWPMKGPFDFIFCRNVVIYFDKSTQRELFDRYANITADKGQLFIGHSESLFKVSTRYELMGKTIYKKCA